MFAGGAALLAIYVGIAASCLPMWSVGALGAVGSPAGETATPGPGGVSEAVSPSASLMPSDTSSLSARTPMPTLAPTPRPYQAAAVPTPDQRRVYHVPILMYHRVVPLSEAGDSQSHLVVPPATFSLQMKALFDAGWHSITMATLAHDMETNATIPARTFVITFDDGWYDGYEYAFPIMRQYGFVGTYYVIGNRVDTKGFLSAEQMQTLEAAGNDIGNHTEDHVKLPGSSAEILRREVDDASRRIQQAIGHRPVTLAYPAGGVDLSLMDSMMREVPDIKLAVTTWPGAAESWPNRLSTPRVRVDATMDGPGLVASLAGT
ncbi:MAG TPA: polysaccharide deacetylase family protein [Candidatus Limnocylindrales bacterium]